MKTRKPQTKGEKLDKLLNDKIMPKMAKFAQQKHLNALKNAFVAFLPFILAGSLGIILAIVLFGSVGGMQTSLYGLIAKWSGGIEGTTSAAGTTTFAYQEGWAEASTILRNLVFPIFRATVNNISLPIAFLIAFSLSKLKGFKHPVFAGLTAMAAFFISIVPGSSVANVLYFRSNGLLTAILVSFASTELLIKLFGSEKLKLKMPDNVPQGVSNSFSALIPIAITLLVFAVLQGLLITMPTRLTNASAFNIKRNGDTGVIEFLLKKQNSYNVVVDGVAVPTEHGWSLADAISVGVQGPFVTLATIPGADLGLALIYVIFTCLFWFFGIHGASVMNGVFLPIWISLTLNNQSLFVAGVPIDDPQYAVFAKGAFDAFVWFGGSGATLALLFGTLISSKNKAEREVAKFATPAGVFNINEPVMFGYPIVLNPVYVVPFIFTPVILTIITWLGLGPIGIVHPVIADMPWVAPIGVGALFATAFDYKALLLALVNFAIAILIYLPFVIVSSKLALKQAAKKRTAEKNVGVVV